MKKARVDRGQYRCVGWHRDWHVVPVTVKQGRKRVRNVAVDHITPVVPPSGFTTWDEIISRLFVEEEGLQVLCKECHDKKTLEERANRHEANRED